MNRKIYASEAEECCGRILALIPDHPEILGFDDPWELFKVPGFQCNDLGLSMAQADGALAKAKAIMRHRARMS